jgi:hypothetical protein
MIKNSGEIANVFSYAIKTSKEEGKLGIILLNRILKEHLFVLFYFTN